jgi:hypothetical protein
MNCLRSLGRWNRRFESHSGHGCLVCVCVYSVFVLSCVSVATLRRTDHSFKESYRLWKTITGLNKRPGPWTGWKSHWKRTQKMHRKIQLKLIYKVAFFHQSKWRIKSTQRKVKWIFVVWASEIRFLAAFSLFPVLWKSTFAHIESLMGWRWATVTGTCGRRTHTHWAPSLRTQWALPPFFPFAPPWQNPTLLTRISEGWWKTCLFKDAVRGFDYTQSDARIVKHL